MAVVYVIDGKPRQKQRSLYIPREGELVEINEKNQVSIYEVTLVQHKLDLRGIRAITDTYVHLDKNGANDNAS